MRKIVLSFIGLVASGAVLAQQPTQKTFWDDPINHPMTPLYLVLALVIIVFVLVLTVSVVILRAFNTLVEQTLQEKAKSTGVPYVPKPSFWSKMTVTLNDAVPIEREKDIDLGHNYDGIRELDNHLPPWWKWLFYGTIGWAVVYLLVFHVTSALPLSLEEYQNEVASAEIAKQKLLAAQPQATIDMDKLEYKADAEIITRGKKVYVTNCVSCHRNDGGGNTIGPNLTDNYWLHGGTIKDVFKTVNGGFVEKGMPAWGKTMSPSDVRDVAFFVFSLQGSNPANAKAPQGEIVEKTVLPKADSVSEKSVTSSDMSATSL